MINSTATLGIETFFLWYFINYQGCGMKSETMADISILNSNLFVFNINLIWLQCAMMHIASLMVIRSGSHTMQKDYHLKLKYLLCSQIINRNVLSCFPLTYSKVWHVELPAELNQSWNEVGVFFHSFVSIFSASNIAGFQWLDSQLHKIWFDAILPLVP